MRKKKDGESIPEEWLSGEIVYLYKSKWGVPNECRNYRPIGAREIAYKIRPGPIATKPAKMTHILTRFKQFDY